MRNFRMKPGFDTDEYRVLFLAVYVYQVREGENLSKDQSDFLDDLLDKITTLGEITEEEQAEIIDDAEIV